MPVIRATIGPDGKTGGTGEDGVADTAPIPQAGARVRRLVLLGLVVLAFCGSLLASKSLFPLGSINHDEQMYVVEAQMLRQGHVTLPTHQAEFFRPWAAGISRGRVVLSYTPPWPAVIAASDFVLGTNRAAPAAIAAALVIAVYLLAVEVSDRWRVGLIAAAVFALSPMVVFLSGTYLPYSFQLLVQVLFAYLVLSGIRLGSAPRLVLAGLAFGVAAFARPFDALLVGLPFLAVVVVTGRRDWRTLLRRVALLFVGVAPLLVLNLWLNAHTMGSPLRSPFTITGSHNTFGFGRRGVFDSGTLEYGPRQAFGSLKNLVVLPGWTFGGVIAVVLAAIGLVLSVRSRRRLPAVVAVAAVAGTVTVGYFFFWSPYAIVHEWPGAATLGPFYHLSLLVPVALFAAVALDRAIDIHPRVAVAGLVIAMVALTLALLPSKLSDNRDVTRDYRAADRVVARVQPPAVVFLSEQRDQGFESTTPFLQNRPDLTGPVLYGSDLSGRDLALLHAMPSRKPYRFVYEAGSDRDIFNLHPSLTELDVRKGEVVTTHLRLRNPGVGPCAVAYARIGDQTTSVVLDRRSGKGRSYDVVWTLRAPSAPSRVSGSPFVLTLPETGPSGGEIRLGARFGADCRITTVDRYERRYPYVVDRASGSEAEVLTPGAGWHQVWFPGHPPAWIRQNLDGIVTERR